MLRRLGAAGLLVWSLATALVVRAQDQEAEAEQVDDDEEEARRLFRAAEAAVSAGRYENALEYFQRAYQLSARPELLFNIGLMADRLHRTDLAIESLEAFLAAMPDAANRAEVEQRLRALRAIEIEPIEAASDSGGVGVAPIALTVAGGVVLIAGAVMLGYALAEKSTLEAVEDGTRYADVAGRHDAVVGMSAAGIVALGIGGAFLLSGIVLWVVGDDDSEASVSAAVGPLHVGIRGRF